MFDKIISQFKDLSDYRDYAESQYNTIIKQSKEITVLQEEVSKLNNLIKNFNVSIDPDSIPEQFQGLADQEIICKQQLQNLRDAALKGDLTLEECKKAEIYTKLLLSIDESKKKVIASPFKKLTEEELIQLAENGTD